MRLLLVVLVLLAIPAFSSELMKNERTPIGSIIVEIAGLGNDEGKARCFLFDCAESLGIKEKSVSFLETDIKDKRCIAVFDSISYGTYAVCLYHDENNNERIDKRFTGFPKEKIGFSNDGKISLKGLPEWGKISFQHLNSETKIHIKLK